MREALVSLQTLGRVNIRTGSGIYVSDSTATQSLQMPGASAFELTQARLLFESEAVALAAPRISDEALERLQSLLLHIQESDSDEEADLADRDFHLAIATATENGVVRRVVESLWQMRLEQEGIKEVYRAVCSHDAAERASEHGEILDALRARDAAAARIAMRKHFRRLIESMLEFSEERVLEEVKKTVEETRGALSGGAQPDGAFARCHDHGAGSNVRRPISPSSRVSSTRSGRVQVGSGECRSGRCRASCRRRVAGFRDRLHGHWQTWRADHADGADQGQGRRHRPLQPTLGRRTSHRFGAGVQEWLYAHQRGHLLSPYQRASGTPLASHRSV